MTDTPALRRHRPEVMRVCWRIELPGILRVACTRHRLSNGDVVGADTINDLDGALYYHENEIGGRFETTLLHCLERSFNAPDVHNEIRLFGIIAYDRNKTDGGLLPPAVPYYTSSVRVPSSGPVEYRLQYTPPASYTADTRAYVMNDRVVLTNHLVTAPLYNMTRECSDPTAQPLDFRY